MRSTRGSLAAVGLVAALAVTGCTNDSAGADPAPAGGAATPGDVQVLQPGRPGEAASTVAPEDVAEPDRQWNHADVAFVQMMIPHHAQALEMSRLAQTRAADDGVVAMARRIRGAQGPEIVAMAAWLETRNLDVPQAADDPEEFDHGGHGHTAMAGMLTAEQMDELKAARGQRFDRLFLEGMIAHHEGAVAMAETTSVDGVDLQVAEMAADVAAGQTAEIARMRDLLAAL
ncbi:MAG TPA: DUF305 domain-containing protein [Nocardioidaceae bacterium]